MSKTYKDKSMLSLLALSVMLAMAFMFFAGVFTGYFNYLDKQQSIKTAMPPECRQYVD